MKSFERENIIDEELSLAIKNINYELKKTGSFETYKSVIINKITNNVFSVESETGNINFFANKDGKIIFNIGSIGETRKFNIYCEILSVEEVKNENGEYEMFVIENGGKKRKLDKYSIEYFEVWETISFLQGRDLVLHILEGSSKKTVMKMEDKMLDMMIAEKSIRLIDLAIFLSKGNLTQDQFKKYHKTVMNLLLDQIGDERFSLLPNNKQYQLSTKEGSFQISTGKVTKEELNYLLSAKLLSPEIHQLAIEKIDELEKLEAEKNTELKKDLDQLENEIRDN